MNILALDLGGTVLKSALFDGDGAILRQGDCPSDGRLGGEALIRRAFQVIETNGPFDRIAVSTTGQVDERTGSIAYANENVPGYNGTPVRAILESRYRVPVSVLNDVNAAALGEGFHGVAKDAEDYLCLTYGTGVGGAIVIGRKVYGGSRGVAGEMGHLLTHPDGLPCACGQRGCYEQYASVSALVQRAQAVDSEVRDGQTLFERLDENIYLGAVVGDWLKEVGHGLVTLTHIFNPSLIVVGGGVFRQRGLVERLEALVLPKLMTSYRQVSIKSAQLGNMAGLYGAYRASLGSLIEGA